MQGSKICILKTLWLRIQVFWSDPDPGLLVGSGSGFQKSVRSGSRPGFENVVGLGSGFQNVVGSRSSLNIMIQYPFKITLFMQCIIYIDKSYNTVYILHIAFILTFSSRERSTFLSKHQT